MNLVDLLNAHPMLVALSGTMVTGSILYLLRAVPTQAYALLRRWFTVELTVTGDDDAYDWVNDWLALHSFSEKARTLKLSTSKLEKKEWSLAPGYGWHFIWDGGPLLLTRVFNDKVGGNSWMARPRETFHITALGRSQKRIRKLIEDARQVRIRNDSLGVRIWQKTGYWKNLPRRSKRAIESVFLPHDQKAEILGHARWFFENQAWFEQRGIPYRQGWLFKGPPGTGKTTVVTAVGSYFEKPLYIINLATVGDDNALLEAFTSTPPSCIVLIEDVDAVGITKERKKKAKPKATKKGEPAEEPDDAAGDGVTLSGLLNAIDGVAASEGRLLIMTTNHPEKLDAALVRKARVDKEWEIGPLQPFQVMEMAMRFFPGEDQLHEQLRQKASKVPLRAAAEWQVEFMDMSRARLDGVSL